jgi:hypothetical protein
MVHPVGYYYNDISRCTVNRTLNKLISDYNTKYSYMLQSIRDNNRGEVSNDIAFLFIHIINILCLAF